MGKFGVDPDTKILLLYTNMWFRPTSTSALDKQSLKENGSARGPLDEATRLKAEASYINYFEYYGDADADAQGTASFN